MGGIPATFRNGHVELSTPVDWPEGTPVTVLPAGATPSSDNVPRPPMTHWPEGFLDDVREGWGNEPFARPAQGEFDEREEW